MLTGINNMNAYGSNFDVLLFSVVKNSWDVKKTYFWVTNEFIAYDFMDKNTP